MINDFSRRIFGRWKNFGAMRRVAEIASIYELHVEKHTTFRGENCSCYMYIAIAKGANDNKCVVAHFL